MLPLTGPLAFLGPPTVAGAELAVDDINAAGGVFGMPVELTQGDSGLAFNLDPLALQAEADRVLADGTQVIVGALSSGVSGQILEQVISAGGIQISPGSTSPFLSWEPDQGRFFRTVPSEGWEGWELAKLIAAESTTATVAFLEGSAYSENIASEFAWAFGALGGHATMIPYVYDGSSSDPDIFQGTVSDIAAAGADALLLVGFGETELLLFELGRQGIGPHQGNNVWGVEGNLGPYLGLAPGAMQGFRNLVLDIQVRDADFVDRLAALGLSDTFFAGQTYDAVVIAALAAVIAGTDDPTRIAQEIVGVTRDGESCSSFAQCAALIADGVNIDYAGLGGEYEFNSCGDPTVADLVVVGYDELNIPFELDRLAGVPVETISCASVDSDGDGVEDSIDVCPGFDDNVDTDSDGIPDGCDPTPTGDDDGDGVDNAVDVCPGFDDNVDTDSDGIPDGCDPTPTGDDDGDGVDNAVDICAATEDDPAPEGLKPNRNWPSPTTTYGCSPSQIIHDAELGRGHERFGISDSALESWLTEVESIP